jgi:hypothetical protein
MLFYVLAPGGIRLMHFHPDLGTTAISRRRFSSRNNPHNFLVCGMVAIRVGDQENQRLGLARSNRRYSITSLKCAVSIPSFPARSAMVRVTLIIR